MVVIKMSFVTITRVLLGTGEPSVPIHYRHCTCVPHGNLYNLE